MCCDNDGAVLQKYSVQETASMGQISWQKIIQKIFKNTEKD